MKKVCKELFLELLMLRYGRGLGSWGGAYVPLIKEQKDGKAIHVKFLSFCGWPLDCKDHANQRACGYPSQSKGRDSAPGTQLRDSKFQALIPNHP